MILSNVKTPGRSPAPVISKRKKVGNKARIYHFHNGSGGGVLSVIRNLLEFSQNPEIENHVIFTINKEKIPKYEVPVLKGAVSESVFYYSPNWNFYHTCKELAKLLPDDKAVIVAHDWLELGMCSNLGLQNPVVQVLHGDYSYYYELAQKHKGIVNKFITVAESICANLNNSLPERIADIFYQRFPVPEAAMRKESAGRCNIVFIGRLTRGKGYHLLAEIATALAEKLNAAWHIIGEDEEDLQEKMKWPADVQIKHYGKLPPEEVRAVLSEMDYFILPSVAEGMPVTIVEAMKSGVIPLVNDIPGGVRELVVDGETGFRIKDNSVEVYAEKIQGIHADELLRSKMRSNCISKANELFAPEQNTIAFEQIFLMAAQQSKKKSKKRVYGSRLDMEWLPNGVVSTIRSLV